MKTAKVSKRVNNIIKERGLSTADLAERTGLSVEFLETVREKDVYPSLGPLLKIAMALGVRLGTLIDDMVSQDPLVTRKDGAARALGTHGGGGDATETLRFYSLGMGKSDRHMEPFFVEILPESANEKKLSSHEGEEFIVVTAGTVEVLYGNETHLLKAGDSIYYNSVVPHYVSCSGDEPATIYAVLYIP